MKTLKYLTLGILLLIAGLVNAQEFQIPTDYKFETVEEIKTYEKDVLRGIDWLQNTPLNSQPDKRKNVNAFVLAWLTVTPSVKITMQPYLSELSKKNPDLLMIHLGGWTKNTLENPEQIKDYLANNIKGVESLLKFYNANLKTGIKKDKSVEELNKMTSTELEAWVKARI